MRTYRLAFFFVLLLAACTPNFPPPEPIDFESDSRILRGEWVGEATLEAPIEPLAYSPDGSRLLAVEAFETTIYDTTNFDVVARLELNEGDTIGTAQFNLDGSVLATTSREVESNHVTVSRWNVLTGERLDTLSFQGYAAGFSADLDRFATLSQNQEQNNEVSIWQMSDQSRLSSFTLSKDYYNVTLSPDFTTFAAAKRNERDESLDTVLLWDLATQETLLEFTNSNSGSFYFSPDGSLLALRYSLRGFVHMWDVDAKAFLFQSNDITEEFLMFNADSTAFVTFHGRELHVRDTQDGAVIKEIELALEQERSALFPLQLNQVAVARLDGGLQVLDLASGSTLAEIAAIETYDLSIDVNATYIDESSYNLSGTLEFGGETYTVQGEVVGGGEQTYLRPTRSLPSPAYFEMQALNQAGEVRWILRGSPPSQDGFFKGEILPATEGFVREFSLER